MSFPNPILSPFSAINAAGFASGSWNTGIASGAPAGATGMRVLVIPGSGGTVVREVRKTGSSDNYVTDSSLTANQHFRWCGLNASGQFDYYGATGANTDLIYPMCFFGPEAVFPTNIIAMPTATTAFATYSTGGNAPSAIAAGLNVHGAGDYDGYFRHPSSTDDFSGVNESNGRRDFFCALDGSQNYACKFGTTGRQVYLVCYFTSNVVEANAATHNAVIRTPGSSGSYQNLATTGDTSPIACEYYIGSTATAYTWQLSGQGSGGTAPTDAAAGGYSGPAFAYVPAQANIANTGCVIRELAYFTGAPVSVAWLT